MSLSPDPATGATREAGPDPWRRSRARSKAMILEAHDRYRARTT
ncbi:hypothetical protein [Embleya sp. NPDC050493]